MCVHACLYLCMCVHVHVCVCVCVFNNMHFLWLL